MIPSIMHLALTATEGF